MGETLIALDGLELPRPLYRLAFCVPPIPNGILTLGAEADNQ